MATKDINTINQVPNYEELVSRFNYYALANLGQRLGVQESSITTESFKIGDFFQIENKENYCIQIKYNNTNDEVLFIPYNILTNETGSPIILSIKETNQITEKIELLQVINDVKFYTNGFVGYNQNTEHFYYSFECFYDNTTINNSNRYTNENFIQYILEEFDHNTNELLYSLKICKNLFTDNNGNNIPVLVYLYKDNNQYKLKFLEIDIEDDERIFDELINNIQVGLNGNNINIPDIYAEYVETFINDNNRIKPIYNNLSELDANLYLDYNTEDNIYFSLNDYNELKFYRSNYNLEEIYFRANNINQFLYLYSQEISYLYTYIKKYYTKTTFLENNNSLKLRIIASLIKEIIKVIHINKNEEITLWAPIDYEINYFCKTDNKNHIFESSNDLFVEFSNSDIENKELKYITVRDNNERKISIYKFNVLYEENEVEDDLIYDIKVKYDYTLPYINENNYWVVNNKTTNVYAKGKNAGQPNIIFLYNTAKINSETTENGTYERNITPITNLLYAANKEKLFYINSFENEFNDISFDNSTLNIHWKEETILLKGIFTLNNDYTSESSKDKYNLNNTFYKLKTQVIDFEKYDEEIQNELLNSVIINITSTKNVIYKSSVFLNDLEDIYGDEGYVTTFWFLKKDSDGKYRYEVLNDPYNNNYIMDLNVLNSINNLILWHLKKFENISPDNYIHNQLILNCSYTTTKNQTENDYDILNKKIYSSLRSIETNHKYNSGIVSSSANIYQDNYSNNTNIVLDFVDTIKYNPKDTRLIDSVYKNTEEYGTWFKSEFKKYVTNYINTYDFIPNTTIPTLELKEILLRNTNTINRNNLIIIDNKEPYYYYSYIGSPYNKKDKKTLVIGTGTVNTSFGTDNMSDSNDFFGKQDSLELNFDKNIYFNSYTCYSNNIINKSSLNTNLLYSNTSNLTKIFSNNIQTVELKTNILKADDCSLEYIETDKIKLNINSFIYYKNNNNIIIEGYIDKTNRYLEIYKDNDYCIYYKFNIVRFLNNNFGINVSSRPFNMDNERLDENNIILKYIYIKNTFYKPIKVKIYIYEDYLSFEEESSFNKWNILSKKKKINCE